MNVGSGLISDVSTSEYMSSGGPKLYVDSNGEVHVFGICVGSFCDEPNSVVQSPPDWTLKDEFKNTLLVDIQLPEKGRRTDATPKNRNIILGIHHRYCIAEMLLIYYFSF